MLKRKKYIHIKAHFDVNIGGSFRKMPFCNEESSSKIVKLKYDIPYKTKDSVKRFDFHIVKLHIKFVKAFLFV